MRCYGFKAEEILEEAQPSLATDVDPKTAWALRHPEFRPVDADTADYRQLLRVPGVGVTGASRIVAARRTSRLRPEELGKMGIVMKRAQWFLTVRGKPLATASDPVLLRPLLSDAAELPPPDDASAALRGATTAWEPSRQLEFDFA